jgi:UDP-N-acetylglucosamine--N-acetylmuramyl-(pentapeptide) pyrophosphoryl-undecaprenol N-acetylglucosamine transferase
MEAAGGAIVIPQQELTGDHLSRSIAALLHDEQRLESMREHSWRMRRTDAAEVIVQECYDLMGVTHDRDGDAGAAGG